MRRTITDSSLYAAMTTVTVGSASAWATRRTRSRESAATASG